MSEDTKEIKKEEMQPNNLPQQVELTQLAPGQQRFRVQFEFTYGGTKGKGQTGEHKTEPDMSMRVSQMLERAKNGQGIPQSPPIYMEQLIPVFKDFTDIENYRDHLKEALDLTNEQIKNDYQATQQRKKQAEDAKNANKQKNEAGNNEDNSENS